jgi:hypothetical protein
VTSVWPPWNCVFDLWESSKQASKHSWARSCLNAHHSQRTMDHITGGRQRTAQERALLHLSGLGGHRQACLGASHCKQRARERQEQVSIRRPPRGYRTEERPGSEAWGGESCPESRRGRSQEVSGIYQCLPTRARIPRVINGSLWDLAK